MRSDAEQSQAAFASERRFRIKRPRSHYDRQPGKHKRGQEKHPWTGMTRPCGGQDESAGDGRNARGLGDRIPIAV